MLSRTSPLLVAVLTLLVTPEAAALDITDTTEPGRWRESALPDGSRLQLSPRSAIEIRLGDDRREMTLHRGGVVLRTPNVRRPLSLRAGLAVIHVLGGGEFGVRHKGNGVVVTVLEGAVAVSPADASQAQPAATSDLLDGRIRSVTLRAGEQLILKEWSTYSIEQVKAEIELSWAQGHLNGFPSSIADLVDDYNSFNVKQIEIADPQIGELRVYGSFNAGDPDGFLEGLSAAEYPIRITRPAANVLRIEPSADFDQR